MNSRRAFLQASTLTGLGILRGRSPLFAQSPNEVLRIACIGVGGKGRSDTEQAANYGLIVGLCDIDDLRLEAMARKMPFAKKYTDYRKMLEEMEGEIDAVTVSTPDHNHAPASIMAMKMGKHVYCQKPLTHTVHEARMMRDLARRNRLATQMGNQGTADSGLRSAVEIIQSGALGAVREVHVWTNRPFKYWKQAPDVVARPKETPPVPGHVHWNEFLGPAPERPYHPIYHPHDWRGWWDFGTGALGDMACHTANLAFKALRLGYPIRISASHSELNPETYPAWATITYDFPARGDLPAAKLVWYEGARNGARNLPHPDLLMGETASDSGSLFIGEKGVMFSPNDYGGAHKLLPEKSFAGYTPPPPTLPRHETRNERGRGNDDNMKAEWVAAIRGGAPALSNFDYSAVLTETMLLGNVAVRSGHPIEYDAARMRITNCREANEFVKYEYREGWRV